MIQAENLLIKKRLDEPHSASSCLKNSHGVAHSTDALENKLSFTLSPQYYATHCSDIASATPENVFALFFALSVVNIPLYLSPCLPEYEPEGHHVAIGLTSFVGTSSFKFFSQRHVFFVYGCPN